MDDSNLIIIGVGGFGLLLVGVFAQYIMRDIYKLIGGIPTIVERVKQLEQHQGSNKKTADAVIRMEEQIKALVSELRIVTSLLMKRGTSDE